MELRSYQKEPVEKGIAFFKKPNPPSIMVLPTAAGKSVMIGAIAKGIEDKVIILQPSLELLQQNYAKFVALGGRATIYSASAGQKQISQVTYATIGSITKLGELFKKFGFTKLIIDECHLYPRSEGMLGTFLKDSGITHCLAFTATPLKLQTNMGLDGNPFSKLQMLTSRSKKGQFFKDIIHVCQINEMVDGGWWSKLIYEKHDIDTSKLQYNSTKADYTERSLELMYSSNHLHDKITRKLAEIPERKSIIVFVPSVEQAKELSKITPNSAAVYGDMDKTEREWAVKGFKKGQIRVVYNVNVLATGFDSVNIDCVITARPTASLAMYYQQIGRGTRIMDGKADCLIVDLSGNVTKFGPVESLRYKKEGQIWKLYGENGVLLTGVPLHEIGKHTEQTQAAPGTMPFGLHRGKKFEDIPKSYKEWMIKNFTWNSSNIALKLLIQNSL